MYFCSTSNVRRTKQTNIPTKNVSKKVLISINYYN
jgi:hypothetical protein